MINSLIFIFFFPVEVGTSVVAGMTLEAPEVPCLEVGPSKQLPQVTQTVTEAQHEPKGRSS